MKRTRLLTLVTIVLLLPLKMAAQPSDGLYTISCDYIGSGFVGLGAYHYASGYPTYYVADLTTATEDCVWEIYKDGAGYTIKNHLTDQYLGFVDDHDCKYMEQVDNVTSDDQRWTFVTYPYNMDAYYIRSVGHPDYYFNLRSSMWLGCYAGGGRSSNELFVFTEYTGGGGEEDDDDYPFRTSSVSGSNFAGETHWYQIRIRSSKYWCATDDGITLGDLPDKENIADEYLWAFVPTGNDHGVRIYNKAFGGGAYLGSVGYENGEQLYMGTEADYPYNIFYYSENNSAGWWGDAGYNLYTGSSISTVNDFSSGNILRYWNSEASPYDNGSCNEFFYYSSTKQVITVSPVEATLELYETLQLSAWAEDGTTSFTWKSSTPKVATVTSTGLVRAMSGGTAEITATDQSGNTATCLITVSQPVTKIIITSGEEFSLQKGATRQLTYEVQPSTAINKAVTWSVSDASIVSVSDEGLVTALMEGTATITATAKGSDNVTATCQVHVTGAVQPEPMTDPMLFVHFLDERICAFPKAYISNYDLDDLTLRITTTWDQIVTYEEVGDIGEEVPLLPYFTSYKFNNKFNDQLYTDVDAGIDEAADPVNEIRLDVGCIGKRLTASFKTSADDVLVYVDTVLQQSKVTRQRFEEPVTYTITTPGLTMAARYTDGKTYAIAYVPYGREVTVSVNFLTDDSGNVPTIYIDTADGASITSKTTYKDATIRIEGEGVFPDFPETAIQIKGRGNTSWGWAKKPYHIKFASKQKPFGMKAGKHWNLLSNYQHNSCMTNAIAMKVADMVEVAGANHIIPVDLILNGEYRGTYNFTEKVGFSNNSIDLDDESCAAMLELDSYYDETFKFRSSYYYLPINIKEPEFDDPESETALDQQMVEDDFNQLEAALYNGDEDYDRLVDIPSACRFFLVNELVYNLELAHPKSSYMYSEDVANPVTDESGNYLQDETPWILGPVWDFDWAFGYQSSYRYYQDNQTADYFKKMLSAGDSNGRAGQFWQGICRGNDNAKRTYYRLWRNFMDNQLDELIEYVDDYFHYATPSFESDYEVWHASDYDQTTTVENAKKWLRTRAEYIWNKCLTAYPDDPEPVTILRGDANGDGTITIADLEAITAHLAGNTPDNFANTEADANEDGKVDADDQTAIASMLLSKQNQPTASYRMSLETAEAALSLQTFQIQQGGTAILPITLQTSEPSYAAAQFYVVCPDGLSVQDIECDNSDLHVQWTEVDNYRYCILLYTDDGQALPFGDITLGLTVLSERRVADEQCLVRVANGLLANIQADDERLAAGSIGFSYNTVGVEADGVKESKSQSVIYDLLGRRVTTPRAGRIYIVNGKKVKL